MVKHNYRSQKASCIITISCEACWLWKKTDWRTGSSNNSSEASVLVNFLPAQLAFHESWAVGFEYRLQMFQANDQLALFLNDDPLSLIFRILQNSVRPDNSRNQSVTDLDMKANWRAAYKKDAKPLEEVQLEKACCQCYQAVIVEHVKKSPLMFLFLGRLSGLTTSIINQNVEIVTIRQSGDGTFPTIER